MGCLLTFGALFLLVIILTFYYSYSPNVPLSFDSLGDNIEKAQPFEVLTKKGMVTLHLGMPKDSVIMIVGKPDDVRAHTYGSTVEEVIGYKVKGESFADLNFTFEDGKLKKVDQY